MLYKRDVMDTQKKIRFIHGFALACNVAIVATTAYAICEMLVGHQSGNMNLGAQTFKYFDVCHTFQYKQSKKRKG